MSRRSGLRCRCTNWQTEREAKKGGHQDRDNSHVTRGKTKAGDGAETEKEREILTGR